MKEDVDRFELPLETQLPEREFHDLMELLTSETYQVGVPKRTLSWKATGQAGILVRRGEHYSGTARQFQEECFDDYIFGGFMPTRRP